MAEAAGYNAFVFVRHGPVAGAYKPLDARSVGAWTCADEWLLSLDNLFVFHLIFQLYKTPSQVVHKALFLGIIGAVICRLGFFAIVRELLDFVSWLRIIFGIFLIWSGVQAAKEEEEGEAVNTTPVKALRWLLGNRLLDHYGKDAGNLIVWRDGNMAFTLLLPVVCCLEITDVVFALDSVSAKAAQIPDYWISVSSSILAMFALRAMFFVVQDFVAMFELMKYGLCCILVFIGIELICSDYFVLPPQDCLCYVVWNAICIAVQANILGQNQTKVFIVSIFGSAALINNGGTDRQKAATDRNVPFADMLFSVLPTTPAPPSQSEATGLVCLQTLQAVADGTQIKTRAFVATVTVDDFLPARLNRELLAGRRNQYEAYASSSGKQDANLEDERDVLSSVSDVGIVTPTADNNKQSSLKSRFSASVFQHRLMRLDVVAFGDSNIDREDVRVFCVVVAGFIRRRIMADLGSGYRAKYFKHSRRPPDGLLIAVKSGAFKTSPEWILGEDQGFALGGVDLEHQCGAKIRVVTGHMKGGRPAQLQAFAEFASAESSADVEILT
ncbi:alx, partial [Symbiodinium sp. CCMP2592]